MGKRRLAFKLAWTKTVSELAGSLPRAAFSGVIAVAGSYGAYFTTSALGREWPGDELIPLYVAFACLVVVWLSWFAFTWLFRVPYEQWNNVEERATELERIIRPKFSVLLHRFGKPHRFNYGHTHRSPFTGSTQSVIQNSFVALAIDVRNETATLLEGCEAYLSHFEEIGGEPSVFQSLRLEWVPVGDEVATVTIPAGGQRTVIVFQMAGHRPAFSHDRMPIEAVHMLKDGGYYFGTVTLTAKNTTSCYVGFRLDCLKDEPPHFSLIPRGFRDADILECPETFIGI